MIGPEKSELTEKLQRETFLVQSKFSIRTRFASGKKIHFFSVICARRTAANLSVRIVADPSLLEVGPYTIRLESIACEREIMDRTRAGTGWLLTLRKLVTGVNMASNCCLAVARAAMLRRSSSQLPQPCCRRAERIIDERTCVAG